jgi:putative restriction endonuclease
MRDPHHLVHQPKRLHRTAYDRNLLGIDPVGQFHIGVSVLAEDDGPTLEAAIKEYHGLRIFLPRYAQDRPHRELLAARFAEFWAG